MEKEGERESGRVRRDGERGKEREKGGQWGGIGGRQDVIPCSL